MIKFLLSNADNIVETYNILARVYVCAKKIFLSFVFLLSDQPCVGIFCYKNETSSFVTFTIHGLLSAKRVKCLIVIFSCIAKLSVYIHSFQTNYVTPAHSSPKISPRQPSAFIRLELAKSDSN